MSINCILSIRDESGKYYIYAYITLLSLFENTREKVRVHILHDATMTEQGKDDLKALCGQYGQEILFHRVPDFSPEVSATISKWFNLGTMYRYYAPDFIEADKAIYLDCDIIVNREIKELHDIPLNGALIAAAPDITNYWTKSGAVRSKYKKKVEFLKLKPADCFDAGVMLMNLERMRELNKDGNILVNRTLAALDSDIVLDYPDQDILNSVCAELPKGLLVLDYDFNYMIIRAGTLDQGPAQLQGKIVQFISKPSEWLFPAHLLFWQYYAKSKFAGDMFERMDAACRSERMRFLINFARFPKHRRHAAALLESGFTGILRQYVRRLLGEKKSRA